MGSESSPFFFLRNRSKYLHNKVFYIIFDINKLNKMKKLFHYLIIFLVIYWCFNNINGCNVTKDIKVPQIEEKGGSCEGCTAPIEESNYDVLETEREQVSYEYLKNAIIRNEGRPKSFIELGRKIESSKSITIVTIDYSIINDKDIRVNRRCVGTHEFTMDDVLISVDITDEII